jgi:hypothetical protein
MQVPKNSELENENEVDVLQIALEEATGMRSKSGKPRTKIAPKFPADEPLSITQEMLDMVGEVNFPGFEEEYKAENVQNQNSPNGQNPENFIRLRRPKLKRDE